MATEWISRDAVVAALDMCAVLAHYDIKSGRGTRFRIHCPFHEDERPSCSINTGAKVFNCFGCGEQGNVFDFIANMEEFDPKAEFRAVLETAIEIIGHNPTPQTTKRVGRVRKARASRRSDGAAGVAQRVDQSASNDAAANGTGPDTTQVDRNASATKAEGHSSNAPKRSRARSKSSGTNEPDGSLELEPNRVLEGPAFPLKLADSHPWLDAQLQRIGVNRSIVRELGIGFETRSNALMANRVCFPIHNRYGDLVAYAGRWASDDADDQGRFFTENGREHPRYRLPKGFHKQLELFNWHRVLEQFEDGNTIVLVEGFWSVLRLQAMTIPSVALMGLSISDAQIRLLKEGGIRSVVVMMDGDEEGQAAADTIISRLASHFFTRLVPLKDGQKPDDVDVAILNEVKALCVGQLSELGSQPSSKLAKKFEEPSAKDGSTNLTSNSEAAKEPSGSNASSTTVNVGNADATTSPSTDVKDGLSQHDQASSNVVYESGGYKLQSTSATASFGWSGFDVESQ